MGLVCMLLGLIFISVNDRKAVLWVSLLVLLFYPPLFVVFSGALILYFGFKVKDFKKNLFAYLFALSLSLVFGQ